MRVKNSRDNFAPRQDSRKSQASQPDITELWCSFARRTTTTMRHPAHHPTQTHKSNQSTTKDILCFWWCGVVVCVCVFAFVFKLSGWMNVFVWVRVCVCVFVQQTEWTSPYLTRQPARQTRRRRGDAQTLTHTHTLIHHRHHRPHTYIPPRRSVICSVLLTHAHARHSQCVCRSVRDV